MANFPTHLVGSALASGAAALALVSADLIALPTAGLCFGLGIVGGLLPDIDAGNSVPTRIIFTVIAVVGTAFCAWVYLPQLGELPDRVGTRAAARVAGCFFALRFVAAWLFARLTRHRGVIHSIPAALLLAVGTLYLGTELLEQSRTDTTFAALFVSGGFVLHLLLDELYSVDIMNVRMKSSFGTALKLYSPDNRSGSLALYLGVFFLAHRLWF